MDGAHSIIKIIGGVVVLTTHAVEASIGVFFNEAVVVNLLQEVSNCVVVAGLCGADKIIIRNVETLPGF